MPGIVASLQFLVIGTILLCAGGWKALGSRSDDIALRSALFVMVRRTGRTKAVYQLVGVGELVVGFLLLLPFGRWWTIRLATAMAVGFLIYLVVSYKVAPGRPCACLGTRETPISWQTIGRAGLLVVLSIIGWTAQYYWLTMVRTEPWSLGIVVIEALVFIGFSPELREPLRTSQLVQQGQVTFQPEQSCATLTVPLSDTMDYLRTSASFREFAPFISTDMIDHWREGCWRFVSFTAEFKGQTATAIFAVPILAQLEQVRAALVNDDGTVLVTAGPSAAESRDVQLQALRAPVGT